MAEEKKKEMTDKKEPTYTAWMNGEPIQVTQEENTRRIMRGDVLNGYRGPIFKGIESARDGKVHEIKQINYSQFDWK